MFRNYDIPYTIKVIKFIVANTSTAKFIQTGGRWLESFSLVRKSISQPRKHHNLSPFSQGISSVKAEVKVGLLESFSLVEILSVTQI